MGCSSWCHKESGLSARVHACGHTHTHTQCFSVRKADGGPVIIPLVLLQYRGPPMNGRVYQRSSWVRAIFVFKVTIELLSFIISEILEDNTVN